MELVWVLWGVLSALNGGLLTVTALNLKKAERILEKVETAVKSEEKLLDANTSVLDKMKAIVLKESNDND